MAEPVFKITNQAGTIDLFTYDAVTDQIFNISEDIKPVWATQQIPQKKGNNRQFMGTQDADVILSGIFRGDNADKKAKKAALKVIAESGDIVRIDTGGYDTSIEGVDYVLLRTNIPSENLAVWVHTLLFSEFNN